MRTWYGAPAYFAARRRACDRVTGSPFRSLTPLVLLVGLFNDRRRLLHDMLVGTVVINNPARARQPAGASAARLRPQQRFPDADGAYI